jgi:hypothetical protein
MESNSKRKAFHLCSARFQDIPPDCIVEGRGFFLGPVKRNETLSSNKQRKEAEKEIGDGEHIAKPFYLSKFPFQDDEM